MQFHVCSSYWCLDSEVDKVVDKFPCLKDFGLELVDEQEPVYTRIRDETGKFIRQVDTTKTKTRAYITIDTIEQLLELEKASGHALIVTQDEIEIYDDYRE